MKKCNFSLGAGAERCSDLPNGCCLVMKNLGVPDGDISKISDALQHYKTGELLLLGRQHQPDQYLGKMCLGSSDIVPVAKSMVEQRENTSENFES